MTGAPFVSRIAAAPIAFNAEVCDAAAEGFPAEAAELIRGAAGSSPFLARLVQAQRDWLADALSAPPEATCPAEVAAMRAAVLEAGDLRAASQALRTAKARMALLIALADLGGVWGLREVTGQLTDFADAALQAAARFALAKQIDAGRLPGMTADDLDTGAGYVVLAMGKHGARELNYSSDIDLICLFDETRFASDDYAEAKSGYVKATQMVVKLLSEITAEGYVFRTDLRLRPSPSTTPVCMAMEAAERYYESVGRTWERAAHIKARVAAGDMTAGARYLEALSPFVWRRHLDFAAIEEAHDMRRKISAFKGRHGKIDVPGHDIKLGAGGIREIEFFAQTHQLIMGGRNPALRVSGTLAALDAEVEAGIITGNLRDILTADYIAHRTLEHRLQMVEDAQTQTVPVSAESRARVAALCGQPDPAAWAREIEERLVRVNRTCESFFAPAEKKALDCNVDSFTELGFKRPESAVGIVERWTAGKIPATRSERARRKFETLAPQIMEAMAGAVSPDDAIAQFDRFLSGLPGGVQLFSLFEANPHLLDLIVEICAAAPRLAGYLGRNAAVLDALLDRDFFEPLPEREALAEQLRARLTEEDDYERVLDAVRRWAKEMRFRAGVQVLRGVADVSEAGRDFSDIADAALSTLVPHVIADFSRRYGPPPGRGLAVMALGKFGSREMTAGSDLDLIVVCDPAGEEESKGKKQLASSTYFARLTQAIIAALTAPTAEGTLYEVDMRLRPSGSQGPVATSLESFTRYHETEAWTWERMALTRARLVCGSEDLGADIVAVIRRALTENIDPEATLADAKDMRRRLIEAKSKERADPWSLKHAAGGLQECEFVVQAGVVACASGEIGAPAAALDGLVERGWLGADEAQALADSMALCSAIQHVERVALDHPLNPSAMGAGLGRALVRTLGFDSVAELEDALTERQAAAAAVAARVFGDEVAASE